jgi:plasmid stability protein
MKQVLIRDLDEDVIEALKDRAALHHRSLQGELKAIVTQAARGNRVDPMLLKKIDTLRNSLKGKIKGNSADLIREDRDR